jgi:hypothetical protein
VIPKVERLPAGHVTVGNRSLGQTCDYVAAARGLLLEGSPATPRHPYLGPMGKEMWVRFHCPHR